MCPRQNSLEWAKFEMTKGIDNYNDAYLQKERLQPYSQGLTEKKHFLASASTWLSRSSGDPIAHPVSEPVSQQASVHICPCFALLPQSSFVQIKSQPAVSHPRHNLWWVPETPQLCTNSSCYTHSRFPCLACPHFSTNQWEGWKNMSGMPWVRGDYNGDLFPCFHPRRRAVTDHDWSCKAPGVHF